VSFFYAPLFLVADDMQLNDVPVADVAAVND
jgi:hypothetical protein